jgi:hypothetical protein
MFCAILAHCNLCFTNKLLSDWSVSPNSTDKCQIVSLDIRVEPEIFHLCVSFMWYLPLCLHAQKSKRGVVACVTFDKIWPRNVFISGHVPHLINWFCRVELGPTQILHHVSKPVLLISGYIGAIALLHSKIWTNSYCCAVCYLLQFCQIAIIAVL